MKLYLDLERLDEAETLANEIVAGYTATKGIDSADAIDAMEFLKFIHFEQGENTEAKAVLVQLYQLASEKEPFGEEAMVHLFELDYTDGKLKNQQARIERLLSFCSLKESANQKDGNYWKARGLLGQAYLANDELKTAEEILLEAHRGLESIESEVDTKFYRKYMGRTAGRLRLLYGELNNDPEEERWQEIYRSFRY